MGETSTDSAARPNWSSEASRLASRGTSAPKREPGESHRRRRPGLRIANLVQQRHGAEPWRYDAATYERWDDARPHGLELVGERVEASWDVRLAASLAERGRAVHEEAMLDELLEDLKPLHAEGDTR